MQSLMECAAETRYACVRLVRAILFIVAVSASANGAIGAERPVQSKPDGTLAYAPDEQGNRILDFSHCGYQGGNRDVPDVPVRATVSPADGDDDARIQAAINDVASLPMSDDGFRGAVLLAPGEFQIAAQIRMAASGVVLRGSGAGEGGTTLIATGSGRRAMIRVAGVDNRGFTQKASVVSDEYAPVGARTLAVNSTAGFRVGQTVLITRTCSAEWIEALGARAFGVGWRPGSRELRWDRIITSLDGATMTIDAPITAAIEKRFGAASVAPYDWPGRIENVGFEDVRLVSEVGSDNPKDEDHAWHGVVIENAQNAWVRRVEFHHFAGGAVALWESTKQITVEDCIARQPVSELGGYRRHTFFTQGQLCLFLRCWSEYGRHDFSTGHCAAGPNAFVNCYAAHAHGSSGPIESWSAGVLYDNVRIDGAGLNLENRWSDPPGTGWSAANCIIWQCRAATIACFRPPTAGNWAIGCWADFSGDGTIMDESDFVKPQSLYQAQLGDRVGAAAAARVDPILGRPVTATNPTLAEAAEFVKQSERSPKQLIDVIRERMSLSSFTSGSEGVRSETRAAEPSPSASLKGRGTLGVQNGWLVVDGKLLTGGKLDPTWWRGTVRPDEAPAFGPAITRFVPGRVGRGFTDELKSVADDMVATRTVAYDHHYGLWYDRRRDDHLMVRRSTGDVAPPFYEQPFARTGRGIAWDGLSKYDLTKFNPWYWQRLHDFAQLCDERGLALIHQNYFQHNILEAGAHWADCPWRPANNVNDTGLPEPPQYIGDKRNFIAPLFYDVSNPHLRQLHGRYIRQCLDNFADTSNVIQMTSAEYSGPLEFTQFWIDTIAEWTQEHKRDVIVGLSAPKDVQDAILGDPRRGPHVDVIDIRYWAYTDGDGVYAPNGGQNLAPRQHRRQTRLKPGGAAAIVKAVREYRSQYPEKAVTYFADENCPSNHDGWAVLMGGGSLPDVRVPAELANAIPGMQPANGIVESEGQWCLASDDEEYLIYLESESGPLKINLPKTLTDFRAVWIDPKSGRIVSDGWAAADRPLHLSAESRLLWLTRR